jgi:hypothetical protein
MAALQLQLQLHAAGAGTNARPCTSAASSLRITLLQWKTIVWATIFCHCCIRIYLQQPPSGASLQLGDPHSYLHVFYRASRQLEATLMTKNRALEDKVAVLRRAGESAAATAAAAADKVELLRRQVIIAESQIKQLEAAVGTRWRKMFDF